MGRPSGPKVKPWTAKDSKLVCDGFRDGQQFTALGRMVARSRQAIHYHLWKQGVLLKGPRRGRAAPKRVRPPIKIRKCLRCRQEFDTEGQPLYTCKICRAHNAYDADQYD
jgi:hypothetical protein